MNTFSTKDIVMKIIGPVRPVGSSHVDGDRLENLRQLIDLVDELVETLCDVSTIREAGEGSIVLAKRTARQFLESRVKSILEYLE